MLISTVVPCYNEEKVLSLTYNELSEELRNITEDYEIIFIDDGSRDGTLSLLKEFADGDTHVRYISWTPTCSTRRNLSHRCWNMPDRAVIR